MAKGAKFKLTDDMIQEIATYVENGMTDKDTADLCNISRETFYRWIREGEMKDEEGNWIRKYKQQHKLVEAITRARAAFKAYHVQSIIRASRKSWQASAWLLERKYPDEYAAIDRNSIIAAIKEAQRVPVEDGLADALKHAGDDILEIGDVPDDL